MKALLRILRLFFFPISILYAIILWIKEGLYHFKIFKPVSFNFPIICVGNLATGGTGKTPMTEYLVKLLQPKYKMATISRGYKRKTKGFAIAVADTTALEIGDEPMQFHKKFPGLTVAVGEERIVAVPQLLHDRPETEVIILDDAFQHRSIQAGYNIILTDHAEPYFADRLFPAGNLRDLKYSMHRADMVIVTKCPEQITNSEQKDIRKKIDLLSYQKLLFSFVEYDEPYHLFTGEKKTLDGIENIVLVTGVANPEKLEIYLRNKVQNVVALEYADHHIYTSENLKQIKNAINKIPSSQSLLVITTEKDAVRLTKFERELSDYPMYVLPMAHKFLGDGAVILEQELQEFIVGFVSPRK